jgi:hypothetical protein
MSLIWAGSISLDSTFKDILKLWQGLQQSRKLYNLKNYRSEKYFHNWCTPLIFSPK